MFGFAASVLVAQASTADYVCWMDMGYGPVNMSHLCSTSADDEPAALSEPAGAAIAPESDYDYSLAVRRQYLPSAEDCLQNQPTDYQNCVARIPVVASYVSPAGRLEIIEDRSVGDFWIRVPGDDFGYGPFALRSQAQEWARNNYIQFFEL
jgi:hypothetical protein